MTLWPLLIPFGTCVLFVIFMVGLGCGWWFPHRDHTLDSIDEFDDFRTALGGRR